MVFWCWCRLMRLMLLCLLSVGYSLCVLRLLSEMMCGMVRVSVLEVRLVWMFVGEFLIMIVLVMLIFRSVVVWRYGLGCGFGLLMLLLVMMMLKGLKLIRLMMFSVICCRDIVISFVGILVFCRLCRSFCVFGWNGIFWVCNEFWMMLVRCEMMVFVFIVMFVFCRIIVLLSSLFLISCRVLVWFYDLLNDFISVVFVVI